MQPLGRKPTHSQGPGHQNCGICHPPTKSGKARERRRNGIDLIEVEDLVLDELMLWTDTSYPEDASLLDLGLQQLDETAAHEEVGAAAGTVQEHG
jgi:hypothetical protein